MSLGQVETSTELISPVTESRLGKGAKVAAPNGAARVAGGAAAWRQRGNQPAGPRQERVACLPKKKLNTKRKTRGGGVLYGTHR